jgi:hypothetical protein
MQSSTCARHGRTYQRHALEAPPPPPAAAQPLLRPCTPSSGASTGDGPIDEVTDIRTSTWDGPAFFCRFTGRCPGQRAPWNVVLRASDFTCQWVLGPRPGSTGPAAESLSLSSTTFAAGGSVTLSAGGFSYTVSSGEGASTKAGVCAPRAARNV